MTAQLGRIVYFVRDAAALAEWYRDTFGLATKYDGLDEGWIVRWEMEGGKRFWIRIRFQVWKTFHKAQRNDRQVSFMTLPN